MKVFWTIFEVLVVLFEGANAMYFVCAFLDLDFQNEKERTKWIVLTLVYAAMVIFLRGASAYEGLMLWFYLCIVFLYLLIFIDNSVINKAFASILTICVPGTVSPFVSNVVTVMFNEPLDLVYVGSGSVRLLTAIIVQALNWYIFRLLLLIFKGKKIQIEKSEWALLITVFALSVSAIAMIQHSILDSHMEKSSRVFLLSVDAAVIIINIVTLRLLIALNKHNKI